MVNRMHNPLDSPWDFDDVYARPRWSRYGSTPDVRPPYLASYGLHDYDPDANWAAASRSNWGARSTRGLGGYGMEGRPGVKEVGGFGPEGGYGEAGRGTSRYGTAGVASGVGGSYGAGGMVGRGPKSYTRSDARIEEDVNEMLTRDPELDASDIEVRVNSGVVELTGTVSDRWAKRRAYDDAELCSGVREVRSTLKVAGEDLR